MLRAWASDDLIKFLRIQSLFSSIFPHPSIKQNFSQYFSVSDMKTVLTSIYI